MKNKIIKSKKLEQLEIDIQEDGFTIWITETNPISKKKVRHWLIDGSEVKKDGCIRLGNYNDYKFNAEYDDINNEVRLVRHKKKN